MKTLLITSVILCIPFIFTPLTVHAQDYDNGDEFEDDDDMTIENTFGIGPRLGYYKGEDAEEGSFYGGLQLRARPSEVVGLEGSIEYRPGTESSFVVAGAQQSVETKFVPVTGSLMLFLPVDGFAPYGLGGVGAYYTIYDSEGSFDDDWDSSFNFGYHAGFGLQIPFSNNVSLNVDYRYLFLTPENENLPEDANFSGNAFTASLMFYF